MKIGFGGSINFLKFIQKLNEQNLENINSNNLTIVKAMNFGQNLLQKNGLFSKNNIQKNGFCYFREFLQEFGFDGLIALIATKIADWKTKNGKSRNNLTYVIFDLKMERIFAKKVE